MIESILRGIPLPSIIVLTQRNRGASAYEVVDGKQRLTSILRFIGRHPEAIRHAKEAQRVAGLNGKDIDFPYLLKDDYPKFRRLWKTHMGQQLSGSLEAQNYFPFKLKGNSRALNTPALAPLAGKYYCQIKHNEVAIGGGHYAVEDVFDSQTTKYTIPLIEYTDATPKQIHEVFNLYNKQGKKLTAEEIRNALFHDVDLARLLLMAAGDHPFNQDVLKISDLEASFFNDISIALTSYGFGTKRYKRTKVLCWMTALLLHPSTLDGAFVSRSTARQIDALFEAISESKGKHWLARADALRQLLADLDRCVESHQAFDGWPPKFRDNKDGLKWQELQLVATLLGTFLIAMQVEDPTDILEKHQESIRRFCADNHRPAKTQNRTQWAYIATVALGIAETVSLDLDEIGRVMVTRYGTNCIPTLLAAKAIENA